MKINPYKYSIGGTKSPKWHEIVMARNRNGTMSPTSLSNQYYTYTTLPIWYIFDMIHTYMTKGFKIKNLDFNNKVNVLCWSIHWIQQKLVLTQNDHLCSVYHSVIHKVLAWWPYRYVSIDFCIDNVPRVNVSSQPYILTNITQVASRN